MAQKVVLITGASSGIGYATALAFAQKNHHVIGTARREERLAELQQQIADLPQPHGEFLPLAADVTDAQAMQTVVQKTVEQFGRLDVLVANAGIGQRGPLVDSDWADIEKVLRTNIDGVLHSIRAAVPAMRQQGGGHIVTISSVTYNIIAPYMATYAATKAFVSSIAASLREELDNDNIWVTDFLVGRTKTEFNERRLGGGRIRKSSLPQMTAEQVAEAIVRATDQRRKRVVLRWIDRLIVLGGVFAPWLIGRQVKKQYQ
ncbi:MAG: SDR family NAD(P)-dependent oxidoreductase [Chloroflexi bacterium]|nr:MAG: SDR family NAD(P)-dependent oxidoreductase [Chloroflexota bacterium]